ncbi:MAG: cyclic nucleotide-binding domain-containing protein [Actinomycetota bacterium]|nr:cyclic nucleotide-binding domain-containing protein [Actinomycetota bacterium]
MRLNIDELLVDAPGSVFEGVPAAELEQLLGRLPRREFPVGTIVVKEGDRPGKMYLVESGSAEVLMADRAGHNQSIARIDPGATFGEMSLLTGDPAVATVRVTDELSALVIDEQEFERTAGRFPIIYRNLAEIMAERLELTNRRAAGDRPGRITYLEDQGAPPLLGYALASSVAWHTRTRPLLVVVGDSFAENLRAIAGSTSDPAQGPGERRVEPGVDVALVAPEGPFSPDRLEATLLELAEQYDHVLLAGEDPVEVETVRRIDLAGAGVPPFSGADETALAQGLLPVRSPAGRALGSIARDLAGLKVGLALGAGSLRGYAHLGVVQALEGLGVTADFLAGTSVGSVVGGILALGHNAREGVEILDRAARSVFRPTLPVYGFLSANAIRRVVQSVAGSRTLESLDTPLAVVAADLRSRREIVFRNGPLWQAIMASMSIPALYPARPLGKWLLTDGGILDPVPSAVCSGMGADVVLAVRLGDPPGEPVENASAGGLVGRPPSAVSVIMPSIELMQNRIRPEPHQGASIMFAPELPPIPGGMRNFAGGRRYFDDGIREVEESVPRLAAALPWLR